MSATYPANVNAQVVRPIRADLDGQPWAPGPAGAPTPGVATPPPAPTLAELVAAFLGRYPNANTKANYRSVLIALFTHAGAAHPAQLTEPAVVSYCVSGTPSNNTVYARRSAIRRFLTWCESTTVPVGFPSQRLSDTTSPLRTYKKTYGKVQSRNPGRWLTYDQAYGQLLAACHDDTDLGLRDEIILRLGLLGLRSDEIRRLRVQDVSHLPQITWTGKGRKPRRTHAGPALCDLLAAYLARYPEPHPDSPLCCPSRTVDAHRHIRRLQWHQHLAERSLNHIVARRARLAGLGHLAPHDLRRSAAGILHRTTDDSGAHRFDLLDIQQVLGHSDPATTMRSYLEPISTAVLRRASSALD